MTTLYEQTVPVFIRNLTAIGKVLAKGEAFAAEKRIDPKDLLEARLIADMAPLTAQIQRMSDSAKGLAVRLGGVENVAMPDEEKTFADLQARIAKTIAFLEKVPADAMNGKEGAPVELVTPDQTFTFTGESYVATFTLPNFYFHMTTAYALLRMKGVPIGKLDFLSAI